MNANIFGFDVFGTVQDALAKQFSFLSEGQHDLEILKSEMNDKGALVMTLKSETTGEKEWKFFSLSHANEKVVQIAREQLALVIHYAGITQQELTQYGTSAPVGKKFRANKVITPRKDDPTKMNHNIYPCGFYGGAEKPYVVGGAPAGTTVPNFGAAATQKPPVAQPGVVKPAPTVAKPAGAATVPTVPAVPNVSKPAAVASQPAKPAAPATQTAPVTQPAKPAVNTAPVADPEPSLPADDAAGWVDDGATQPWENIDERIPGADPEEVSEPTSDDDNPFGASAPWGN